MHRPRLDPGAAAAAIITPQFSLQYQNLDEWSLGMYRILEN